MIDVQADQVMLVRLSEEDYRNISFLDQRIITPQLPRQLVEWDEVAAISLPKLPKPLYIFHIGHVGSTLISRLLGEHENVLALREPAILRQFSEMKLADSNRQWDNQRFEHRLTEVGRWLSRAFQHDQRALVKASSFVSPLAADLLGADGDGLFLRLSLKRYMQTILAGEAPVQEAETLASTRLLRLNKMVGQDIAELSTLSLYQKVTLNWLCEMTSLTRTQHNCRDANIKWMDFDDFLGHPVEQLQVAASHFGLEMPVAQAMSLINSPIMTSYSKAPEHDYSPSLREELLQESDRTHADGIRGALLWAEKLAKQHKPIEQAMEQAEKSL